MDKINLEYAKYFYNDNDKKSAKKYLFKIINKQNYDWFTCYRAYFLMYKIDFKNKSFVLEYRQEKNLIVRFC